MDHPTIQLRALGTQPMITAHHLTITLLSNIARITTIPPTIQLQTITGLLGTTTAAIGLQTMIAAIIGPHHRTRAGLPLTTVTPTTIVTIGSLPIMIATTGNPHITTTITILSLHTTTTAITGSLRTIMTATTGSLRTTIVVT